MTQLARSLLFLEIAVAANFGMATYNFLMVAKHYMAWWILFAVVLNVGVGARGFAEAWQIRNALR